MKRDFSRKMMSSKVKAGTPGNKGKVTGLPSTTSQSIKMATSQGLSVGASTSAQNVNTSNNSLQHPSHAKKLSEGKMTGSKAGLGQHHKFNTSAAANGQPGNIGINVDL